MFGTCHHLKLLAICSHIIEKLYFTLDWKLASCQRSLKWGKDVVARKQQSWFIGRNRKLKFCWVIALYFYFYNICYQKNKTKGMFWNRCRKLRYCNWHCAKTFWPTDPDLVSPYYWKRLIPKRKVRVCSVLWMLIDNDVRRRWAHRSWSSTLYSSVHGRAFMFEELIPTGASPAT